LLAAACAHPGFRFIVQNEDPAVSFVRFSFEGGYADFVYESPVGSVGTAHQGYEEWRGTVDFLAEDCTVVSTLEVTALGDVLVHRPNAGAVATASWSAENEIGSLAESDQCVRR